MKRKRHTAAWICLVAGLSVWLTGVITYSILMWEYGADYGLLGNADIPLEKTGRYTLSGNFDRNLYYIADNGHDVFYDLISFQVENEKVYAVYHPYGNKDRMGYGILNMATDEIKDSQSLEDFTPGEREILENKNDTMLDPNGGGFFFHDIPPRYRLERLQKWHEQQKMR